MDSKPVRSTHDLLTHSLLILHGKVEPNSPVETSKRVTMPVSRSTEGYAMSHLVCDSHGGSDDT